MGADDLFESVAAAFGRDHGVARGRMFGSAGLKVDGKVFAMLVRGRLVVKLPRDRVEALVAAGEGEPFDPGHGRVMKEWVAVATLARSRWLDLARAAKAFVASQRAGRSRRRA